MIQLKNDSIRKAYDSLYAPIAPIYRFAVDAYKNLDDTYNYYKTNVEPQYQKALSAVNAQTRAAIDAYESQKIDAKDSYLNSRNSINSAYRKYENKFGSLNSSLVGSGLKDSGYADVIRGQAFIEKQNQLGQANASLQRALTELDRQITEAKLAGDAQKQEILMQKMQQGLQLQQSIAQALNNIASQVYSMNTAERNYQYQVQQDRIANQRAKDQYDLQLKQYEWQKQNDTSVSGLQAQIDTLQDKINDLESGGEGSSSYKGRSLFDGSSAIPNNINSSSVGALVHAPSNINPIIYTHYLTENYMK